MEFIDLKRQYQHHREVIDAAVAEVIASARYILGRQGEELEERLADYAGVGEAIGFGSGTDAIQAALMALELKPGDEVICPAFTFVAPAETVALLGGRPAFVDSEPTALTIDPAAAAAAITEKTVGLFAVDLFGQCARLEEIEVLAQKHGLWVIEDGAQSFGARRNSQPACSFGTIAVTSFFPAKPLSAYGDGGMAFTNDDVLANRLRAIRNHGQSRRYRHDIIGFNGRLDTLQAAVVLAKLGFFEEEVEKRQAAAQAYNQALAGLDGLETPALLEGNTSIWAQYTIKADRRDELAAHLKAAGIPFAIHYSIPLNRQPAFQGAGPPAQELPVAEDLCGRVISLPMHPYLTEAEQNQVVAALASFFESGAAAA